MNITIDDVKRYTRLWEYFRDEHDKLKKKNRELKKRIRVIEEARTLRLELPDSWFDDEEDPC